MYGSRARIGYACPPKVAEVFVYEFYKIVPPGVTLAISTVGGGRTTMEDLRDSFNLSIAAAEELAKNGVNSLVLGGEPLNATMKDELDDVVKSLSDRFGIPVTTSLQAQAEALRRLGAQKVGVIAYNAPSGDMYGNADLVPDGMDLVASRHAGYRSVHTLGTIPTDVMPRLARELKQDHPEIDSIKVRTAHWATVEAIDAVERELDVNVVSASLAITWAGLRQAGIADAIPNKGRLLREH